MNHLNIVPIIITTLLCTTTMNTRTNPTKIYGSAHLSNQNYTDLDVKGSAHLTNVTVANHTTIFGSAHLVNFTCPQLTVKGSLHSETITVEHADIFGALQCRNGKFDTLIVRGSIVVHSTKINSKLSVHGSIIASKIECPLIEALSAHITFTDSSIGTLIVKERANPWASSTYKGILNLWGLLSWGTASQASEVYLDGTCVDSITFQGLPGRVILTHEARVGTVVNGTVERL